MYYKLKITFPGALSIPGYVPADAARRYALLPATASALLILSLILIVSLCLFFIIRSALNKKFRARQNALQQKQAIEKERRRIAADMHDEIGAGLTNIVFLSKLLKQAATHSPNESLQVIHKIEASSHLMITKMNEVIWPLDTSNHTLKDLIAYIRRYTTALCDTLHTSMRIHVNDTTRLNCPLPAEHIRHIFLVVKELLSNAVKHSGADCVSLSISLTDLYTLCIDYHDNGSGFNPVDVQKGNGLRNIKFRIAECQGSVCLESGVRQGCTVSIKLPLDLLKQ